MHFSKALLVILGVLLIKLALTHSQLTSESASEGPCVSPPTITDPLTWIFIFSYLGIWNIPMGNEFLIRKYAEIFLNRPANDASELAAMQLKANCTALVCNLSGYSNSVNVVQACFPTSFGLIPAIVTEYTCPSVAALSTAQGAANFANSTGAPPKVSVIYTDLTNTLVLSECINGTNRGFLVFSKSATLSPSQTSTVVSVLQNAGYNPDYFYYT